ncbi:MAG: SRPBCC domain-containing protein [Chloroflexi bacterium]|nr:SRPBCC domain-containing protein [Chloroflexota bacterium]
MLDSFRISMTLPVSSERVYKAWLNSKEHAAFTSEPAKVTARKGGAFTAGDGYIQGKNLELEPYERIVQAWRTVEFPEGAEDSRLELRLQEVPGGTRLILVHTKIPEGQGPMYRDGWKEFYFKPMRAYFAQRPQRPGQRGTRPA